MVLFDSIIGMRDRHWENYGILKTVYLSSSKTKPEVVKGLIKNKLLPDVLRVFPNFLNSDFDEVVNLGIIQFAPIYDSCGLFWNLEDKNLPQVSDMQKFATRKSAWYHISVPGIDKSNVYDLIRYLLQEPIRTISGEQLSLTEVVHKEYVKIASMYNVETLRTILESNNYGYFSDFRISMICNYMDIRMKLLAETVDNV
jgi:hypothetical protein